MPDKDALVLPYGYEARGDDYYLLNLYCLSGGKVQRVVHSPEGLRGLDDIAATIRAELRAERVAQAAAAHDEHHSNYGGLHG